MKPYTIMAKMQVDINRTIQAESLADAVQRAAKMNVLDFVRPHKDADDCFNDFKEFEVYGVYKD